MIKESYIKLGEFIEQCNERNINEYYGADELRGINNEGNVMPSKANIIGVSFHTYKIAHKGYFIYNPARLDIGSISCLQEEVAIFSQMYVIFKIKEKCKNTLLTEYLWMWFKRKEFFRYVAFVNFGSVREMFTYEDMCNVMLPVPPIEEQRRIVSEYQTVERRITNNEALIQKLEETAQAIYHHTFVEGIDEENLPEGWRKGCLEDIAIIIMGQSPNGNSLNEEGRGDIFYQGRTDFGFRYPNVRVFSEASTRYAEQKDILMSVRAPVGDLNIAPFKCAIGRGISAIREKRSRNSFIFYLLKEKKKELKISDDAGTVFGSINKEGLHSLPLIVPSDNDIERFHSQVSLIDKYIESLSFESFHLRTLLSLLTSKLS